MSDSAEEGARPGRAVFSSAQFGRVRTLLARLYGVRRAVRFYPDSHLVVRENIRELMNIIEAFHAEGVDIPLAFFEGELLLGDQFMAEESIIFDQLIRDIMSLGIGSITFRLGLTVEELQRVVHLLSLDPEGVASRGGMSALVSKVHMPHVEIGAVRVYELPKADEGSKEDAQKSYSASLDLLRELELVIRSRRRVFPGHAKNVVRSLVDNVLANRFAIVELSGLKNYDEYTFYHSVNVAILSIALASIITQERRFLTSLGTGALMHDIGKMTIGSEILNKPGSLTPDEWSVMRDHPVRGAEIAVDMPGMDKASVVVILQHHMRIDGHGYPRSFFGRDAQHLASRIVAIADAFDAMTSKRVYSAARLQDDAMAILVKNRGTAFDPKLVRLFVQALGIYPPRSLVRLSTGELALVVYANTNDATRPTVRLIADPEGVLIGPVDIDLGDPASANGRTISNCVETEGLTIDVDDYM